MIVNADASMPSRSLSPIGLALVVACLIALPFAPVRAQAPAGAIASRPAASTQPAGAATAAAETDPATRRAVQALLAAAADANSDVQIAAFQAIARFGPAAVPTLVEALDMSQGGAMASSLLASMGEVAIDPLLASLKSKDPMRRLRTLQALDALLTQTGQRSNVGFGSFGGGYGMGAMEGEVGMAPAGTAPGADPAMMGAPFGGAAVPPQELVTLASRLIGPVAERVGDDHADVRLQAVRMLGKLSPLHPDDASAAKAMVASLADPSVEVRRAAASALLTFGPAVRADALKVLTSAVKDSDAQVRAAALDALGAIGPAAKDATETIIDALKDPQAPVRVAAARALGAMQPQPEPAPALPGGFEGQAPGGFAPGGNVPGAVPPGAGGFGAPK